jgi:hypothetical protein
MGTIRSPCRYDVAARQALQSANLRRLSILCYAMRSKALFEGLFLGIFSKMRLNIDGDRDVETRQI